MTDKKPATLFPLPVILEPFEKVAIDIVGPLPTTAAGNRFILTVIDLGSLYPEAIALPSHMAAMLQQHFVKCFLVMVLRLLLYQTNLQISRRS